MHAPQYKACPYCRTAAELHASHCSRCGQMFQGQPMPPYGAPMYAPNPYAAQAGLKVPAGLCGILLGSLGIHKFVLGYITEGIIMLLVTVVGGLLTCGISSMVMHVIGLAEGIIYLSKSDPDFVNTYVVRKQGWF
jgi:TM2 domain-containing membrane protein YozV